MALATLAGKLYSAGHICNACSTAGASQIAVEVEVEVLTHVF